MPGQVYTRMAVVGFGLIGSSLARIARELLAEESNTDATLRYAFREDPRLDWLVGFLTAQRGAKVLLICKSQRKVVALETALLEGKVDAIYTHSKTWQHLQEDTGKIAAIGR